MTPEPPEGPAERTSAPPAAQAVQALRRADAHLSRRRLATQRRGATDRAAVRFVIEQARSGRAVSPSDLARYLEISTASVTAVLERLMAAQLVSLRPHPTDKRRKLVEPFDPDDDENVTDPLTAHIRSIAAEYSGADEKLLVEFLARITDAVNHESER